MSGLEIIGNNTFLYEIYSNLMGLLICATSMQLMIFKIVIYFFNLEVPMHPCLSLRRINNKEIRKHAIAYTFVIKIQLETILFEYYLIHLQFVYNIYSKEPN